MVGGAAGGYGRGYACAGNWAGRRTRLGRCTREEVVEVVFRPDL